MNGRRSNPTLMRRHLAAALLLVCLSAPAWAAGTVSGTVTVPEGRSLEGALVTATGTTYKVFRTEVSEDGAYALEVEPGTYTVAVAARGLAFGIAEKVQVSEGQTVTQAFALEVPQPLCIVKSTAPIPLTEDINAPAFADAVELRLDSGHYLENTVNFDLVSDWLGPATIGGRVRLKYSEVEQLAYLERLTTLRPSLALAQELVREFFALARRRDATALEPWRKQVAASGIVDLQRFSAGLQRDWDAVVAGLSLEWSTGPVEGQINRLKMLKRQMYGRAGVSLLRARVLPPAAMA